MQTATQVRKQTKAGRFYEIDNELYPSVTNILSCINKPALVNWAAKVEREMVVEASTELYLDCPANVKMSAASWKMSLSSRLGKLKASQKELAKASEIGSQVHALIEWGLKGELCYDAGPSPRICDQAQWAYMAWEDWRKTHKVKPITVEQVVWSHKYGYAGTLDLLAEVDGFLTVVDWKTGKAVYSEAHLQNAAYRQAIREMGHGDPVCGMVVRLPKNVDDPEFEVVTAKPEKECFDTFLDTMRLWKWCQKMDAEYEEKKTPKTPVVDQDFVTMLQKSIEQRGAA